jgi:hypothetical protein
MVRDVVRLETADAEVAIPTDDPLFQSGIENHATLLRDTLDLRETVESIPGLLYSIRYGGEDPLRVVESLGYLYATTVQLQGPQLQLCMAQDLLPSLTHSWANLPCNLVIKAGSNM